MKRSVRIMAAGLAASLALVSCAKQDVIDNCSANPAGGARTIAVSFANASVKSELNGLQPKFVANDVIKVSNGTDAPVNCTVEIDGSGNASITTSLTGALTAVYPSTAAKMNDNAIDGILVPTVQDGTFASANICKAIIAEKATEASFENQTAVFCITPGAGANTEYIEVITAGSEIANSVPADSEYDTMHKIHVASASAAPVYVSILVPEGLRIRDLSFADGSNMKTLKDDTDAIAVNSLYIVTNQNWNRPYVDLQMTVGGKTRTYKWATCNIGADDPRDYGYYFFWGGTEGYEWDSANSKWVKASDHTTELSGGFKWANAPFNNGSSDYDANYFSSVRNTVCPADILAKEYDAAHVNWGGTWRMFTTEEFKAMKDATYWKWEDGGYYVYTPNPAEDAGKINSDGIGTYSKSDALLFFPAAGWGSGASLRTTGSSGLYWSSSLYSSSPSSAYDLFFFSSLVYPQDSYYRYGGRSVRPLSD